MRPIYVYGSAVLRQVAKPIDANYPNLKELIAEMFESMEKSDGIGLAAPQIGLSIRLFVVDATAFAEENPELKEFRKPFINAQILERGTETVSFNEGCLSLPGIHGDVIRPTTIRMSYCDEDFVQHEETFSGIVARIIQHEYDHIEGILFTDKLSAFKKQLIKTKLNNIMKGKVKVDYRMKFSNAK